ncbi:MAG: hypothetical protein QT00_C0002G0042 [archaeon GW2011_AR5]|nr:MAG: hypothetical protein QT00_C0002G0042 [archaeon GW2011_AR5]
MAVQSLRLPPQELPIGVDAHIFVSGNDHPEAYEGSPMVFRALYGGVPMRRKVYHMENGKPVAGFEGFKDGVTVSPAELYTLQDAPSGRRYVPFADGKRLIHGQYPHGAEVTKPSNVLFYSCSFPFRISPHYDFEIEGFRNMSDGEVMAFLQDMRSKRISTENLKGRIPADMAETELRRINSEIESGIRALVKRCKDDVRIVELLQSLDEGAHYLPVAELPENTLLAPLARH